MMNTNLLALASGLSDPDLLARIAALAGKEREASVELVAHLAELDTRASLYAAHGYGSLFTYCREALKLSEDAACNRISAARACRRFPVILDALASGALSLTSVRMLSPHLTPGNHAAVLARASGLSRREIEALVAELEEPVLPIISPAPTPPTRRPIVETTSPERYRVQFTIGKESHDKLRRVQALLRREIRDGDPGAIFDRAIALLLEKVEKEKLGAAAKPRTPLAIRPGTDRQISSGGLTSRHMASHVKRSAWRNDGGQCAFVSKEGRRCTERAFLEFHHIRPYALGGPTTAENISLRCRRHNQYEADSSLALAPGRARAIRDDRSNRTWWRGQRASATCGREHPCRRGIRRPRR
jgi:hypothetical protein